VELLHQSGYAVRALCLIPPETGLLPAATEVQLGDITVRESVQSAIKGAEVVLHLAALLHMVNPPEDLHGEYERINVGGTANVVEAAREAGVRRLVFFSTIAVYGPGHGQIFNEDTPPRPDTFYAQTKLAAERFVLEARRNDGHPLGTVLRLAAVYGARVQGNYRQLLQTLARRRFIPFGSGKNRRTLVYDHDVARAALLSSQHPAAAGRVFNVTDGRFHALQEIIAAMCFALGRPEPRFALAAGPVRLTAGIVEYLARLTGRRPPIQRATVDKYLEDVAVEGSRLQQELGFAPQYDLKTGWCETIQELNRMGQL
jgi:UDP-glucose 4-epimerase